MNYYGYLYTYFRFIRTGKDLQQVYFALSQDGVHFTPLNDNQPILESSIGTKGVRDPHIIRSELDGKFYLLGTDLDSNKGNWIKYMGNGSKNMIVWKSENLTDWEPQTMVKLVDETIGCVWAPKVCFDKELKDYVVFFSGSEAGSTVLKVHYCRTADFVHFTKPKILIDKQSNIDKLKSGKIGFAKKWITYIDSTTVHIDDMYYRFTKNEMLKTIQFEKSSHIVEGFKMVKAPVAGERGVEGPGVYKLFDQDKWVLLLDGYWNQNRGTGYFPLVASTEEFKQGVFTRLSNEEYSLPKGCKHGSVIPVYQDEYERLLAKWRQ